MMGQASQGMGFQVFQSLCPHGSIVYPYQDDHTRLAQACRRKDRIPTGHSWGICDEAHCPQFGTVITGADVTVHNEKGTVIARCESIKATCVKEPEDWE